MNAAGAKVLLADIGGTNARFALADPAASMPLLADTIRTARVASFDSLADAAQDYLQATGARVQRGVFAVAGPVDGDEVRMTNHRWRVSASQLGQALQLDTLQLVNDFAAQAMALPLLREGDLVPLGGPARPVDVDHALPGTCVVLGPGTGLGVGALLRREGRWLPLATEGGHAGFAPETAEEIAILQRLSARFGRVSNERLLSGDGLVNLHRALGEIAAADGSHADDPGLQPAAITAGAAVGDPRCVHAVELFCALLGVVAGDLALSFGAWDGVFISGGMLPHVLENLQASRFRARFEGKGRYAEALSRVPTLAVMHPQPGLLGAAAFALADAASGNARVAP